MNNQVVSNSIKIYQFVFSFAKEWLVLQHRSKSAVSKNHKIVYGRPSIKWTSWKGNDMLLKVD